MSRPNFIDIEASGLHFDSYPIEIAVTLNGKVHAWLIQPEPGWTYWSEQAEAMHGLSRTFLQAHGLSASAVAQQLNEVLADSEGVVYSDACAWDEDWINTLFFAADEIRQFHILPVDELFAKQEMAQFQTVLAQLHQDGQFRRHRAAGDVAALEAAWRQIRQAEIGQDAG
jgi:hypothetical protein